MFAKLLKEFMMYCNFAPQLQEVSDNESLMHYLSQVVPQPLAGQ